MPGFDNTGAVVDAELNGDTRYSTWRKQPTQSTANGVWFDLSMSPGNPVPNYYAAAPLVSMPLAQSTDGGIFHAGPVAPQRKYLRKLMVMSVAVAPLPMILCDYLMYYPFIDESLVETQFLINNLNLPRYPKGDGVQMMAIVVAGQTGGQDFYVTYTNSKGVSGCISQTVKCTTQAVNGTVLTSQPVGVNAAGPFIPLQDGDSGVRSVESVTMLGSDVGLFSLVLVKPIAQICLGGVTAPTEVDYLIDFSILPEIKDDAYLNFICHPVGSLLGAPIHGDITVVWN
jgi:hypothetical protein